MTVSCHSKEAEDRPPVIPRRSKTDEGISPAYCLPAGNKPFVSVKWKRLIIRYIQESAWVKVPRQILLVFV